MLNFLLLIQKNLFIDCDFDQISRLIMNILKNSVESL